MLKIYNSNCLEVMKEMSDDSVDFIITDPPYNLGDFVKKRNSRIGTIRENFFYDAGWDNMEFDEWKEMMDEFFNLAAKLMKTGGSMVVFMSSLRVETIIQLAEKYGFYYKTTGVWHKTNPMPRNMNLQFINSIEAWIYFTYKKKTGTFNNDGKALHNFIETSVTSSKERKYGKHPTQKPEILIKHFVDILSNKGELVFDPFMGSGTAGVVAVREGRNFIGIELNTEYFEIAKERIECGV